MDENSIAAVKECMSQLPENDVALLLEYMKSHKSEWDQNNPCEGAKKLLKTALAASERKKYFIMGIFLTMLLNIFGIVMFYYLAQDQLLVNVPEIAKSVN